MNYKKYITGKNTRISVSANLVEVGDVAWQINNIVATSVKSQPVKLNQPEPQFHESKPELAMNWKWAAILAFGAWILVGGASNSGNFGLLAALAVFVAMFMYASSAHDTASKEWQARKDAIERAWKIWDYMRRNPPILHSLMFETSGSSHPVLYSTEESKIREVNDSIKKAMNREKIAANYHVEIENVNVGGDGAINNYGSEIYNQAVGDINFNPTG